MRFYRGVQGRHIVYDAPGPDFNSIFGYKYYNDLFYRIPIYNLVHPFLSTTTDHLYWSQISLFLNNVGLVLALILALACTFYSAVGHTEMMSTEVRFSFGIDPAGPFAESVGNLPGYLLTPWDQNFNVSDGPPTMEGVVKCSHPAAAIPPCILGEDLTGKCAFPCFQQRAVDQDNTMVSGAYAKWWYERGGENREGRDQSPVAGFNKACINSVGYLTTGLLATVLGLAIAPANPFLGEDNDNTHSQANAIVMYAYTFWMKMYVLIIIFFSVLGFFYFLDTVKFIVYIKFTDEFIENAWEVRQTQCSVNCFILDSIRPRL